MPLSIPTKEELVAQIQKALRERAGITNFSESSVAGTLANTLATFLSDIYGTLSDMEIQNNLSTAYGPYLDRIGELFGLARLQAKSATTVGSGRSVLFTNPTANVIAVPANTRIWSRSNYSLAFYTTATVTVPAADANGVAGRAYVDVAAAGTGDAFNVAPNTLTIHNAGSQFLQVSNVRAITNGASMESDDNYRYRIKNALLARQGDNETRLRLALLELPGVRDVVIRPLARGTGTVDAIIVPTDRYVSDALIDQAQIVAEEAVALGVSVQVKAPVEHPVDVEIQIAVASGADKNVTKSLVSSQIRSYLDNLPIGDPDGQGDLIVTEIIVQAKTADANVKDVNISKLKIDNKNANIINHRALPGERYYLQSVKVV